jgi:hypothetical protein
MCFGIKISLITFVDEIISKIIFKYLFSAFFLNIVLSRQISYFKRILMKKVIAYYDIIKNNIMERQ